MHKNETNSRIGCGFCFLTLDAADADPLRRQVVRCQQCGRLFHAACQPARCTRAGCDCGEFEPVASAQAPRPGPLLPGRPVTVQRPLTPSLSDPMGEGARLVRRSAESEGGKPGEGDGPVHPADPSVNMPLVEPECPEEKREDPPRSVKKERRWPRLVSVLLTAGLSILAFRLHDKATQVESLQQRLGRLQGQAQSWDTDRAALQQQVSSMEAQLRNAAAEAAQSLALVQQVRSLEAQLRHTNQLLSVVLASNVVLQARVGSTESQPRETNSNASASSALASPPSAKQPSKALTVPATSQRSATPSGMLAEPEVEVRADFALCACTETYHRHVTILSERATPTALARWKDAAARDQPEAQYLLGECLEHGIGGPVDSVAAAKWYKSSAEKGLAWGQAAWGQCLQEGKGTTENRQEAARWLRKAADQGLASAQYLLGITFQRGLGVGESPIVAAAWFSKAAEQGLAWGELALGSCYENGTGISRDAAAASKWYQKAGARELLEAAEAVKRIRGQAQGSGNTVGVKR